MNGILMTPDNFKAIREDRKTVTRRCDQLKSINHYPDRWIAQYVNPQGIAGQGYWFFIDIKHQAGSLIVNPKYKIGQTIYVKEAWRIEAWDDEGGQFRLGYKLGGFSEWLCVTDEILTKYWTPNANNVSGSSLYR
jgi:hypothetical protein